MAIENTYLLGKNITLGCGFDLQAKAPLDSRQTVPAYAGLQALIDGNAAYEGMIVYDEETKKTYQAQLVDGVLAFREFGINEAELKDLIASETTAAMEFKGAATALPENPAKGDFYKVTAEFAVGEDTAKIGDSIVYDGAQWFLIPSGDDIEDTWRPVTDVNNDATLTFAAGDKLDVAVASNGTVTYSHEAIDAPTDNTSGEEELTRTYITSVETDGHGHITGYKTATETVDDTNTTYTFEGQSEDATSVYFQVTSSEEGATAEVVYLDAYSKNEIGSMITDTHEEIMSDVNDLFAAAKTETDTAVQGAKDYADSLADNYAEAEHTHEVADITDFDAKVKEYGYATTGDVETALAEKVDKVDGKSLVDDAEITKLSGVSAGANKVEASENGKIKIDGVDTVVYTHPEKHAIADVDGLQGALDGKVSKEDGKSLIADSEIARLANVDNYDDEEVRGLIGDNAQAIEDLGEYVGTIPTNYTETNVIAYINKKAEETLSAAQGGSSETAASVKQQLDNYKSENDTRVKAAEDKITALETESAKHALKTEVEAVDAKFADYTKTADLPTDLGDFTNDAGYAKTADVNTELDKKADKTQVATDIANAIAPLATTEALNGVKATAEAATTVEEVDAQIDAKIGALNLGTTYEPIGAEDRAKGYVDQKFTDANLAQYTTEQEVKDIVDGVIAGAADSETYNSLTKLVDYIDTHGGEATEMAQAIEALEGKVETIEGKPAYGITETQISNWDNEVGAKALAETKTTAAEVKTQIEAYGYATAEALATEKSEREAKDIELATAIETAKTEASNKDAVVLSEAQKYADQAEADAIAAAKTETENQVKALADGQVATNKDDIASLLAQLTWGEF